MELKNRLQKIDESRSEKNIISLKVLFLETFNDSTLLFK